MQQGIAIFIFILAFAVVSALVWAAYCRDWARGIRVAFLFFNSIYFLLSIVKSYLGSNDNTLFESFWDMEIRTYIHYGIPIALFCIATLILLLKVKWLSDKKMIDIFCALMFPGTILLLLLNGRINNLSYCILFAVCAGIALVIRIVRREELVYYWGKGFGRAVHDNAPYVRAWVVMHCIFLPSELYLRNPGEFTGKFAPFLAIMVLGAVFAACVILFGELFLLPKTVVQYMNLFIMGITFMGYLQNIFLNGRLEILDGDEQMWPAAVQAVNILLWLLVIAALFAVCAKKPAVIKAGRVLCTYIVLIQAVTLVYLVATTDLSGYRQSEALTTQHSLEVAEGQNVLVFVLDRFDSSWMETVYEENEEFCSPLADFTFYRNATSQFANTGPGIPYLLTATAWKEAYGTAYDVYAYQDSSLLQDIKKQGFDLGIYTNVSYVSDQLYDSISNYEAAVEKAYDVGTTMLTMWKCAMYQTSPFLSKHAFSYYSDDIESMVKAPLVWNTENDFPFSENLRENGLSVSGDYAKAFRFYHMHGAHEPYTFSEDMKYDKTGRESDLYSQIRGSMKIVYLYMEELKALGKYDDATIIITADHGQQTDFIEETGKPQRVSSPVILIKEPYAEQDCMQIKDVPVSQAEMIASMVRTMGMDSQGYGATLDEAADAPAGERTFLKLYPEFVRYTIVGDVWDINNWRGELLQE